MTQWLSRCIVQNGALKVQIRTPGFFGSSTEWFSFHLLRRTSNREWTRAVLTEARTGNLVVTRSNASSYEGYLLGAIRANAVHVYRTTLHNRRRDWEAVIGWQRDLSLEAFGVEMHRLRYAASLQLVQRLSIGVAICTGIAVGGGFGPLAGAFGLAASGGTGTAVMVGAVSSALATFIHQNFQAMQNAVRQDPQNGAAHYYRAHSTDFGNILINTGVSGAFGGGTALIPGPRGCSSFDDLAATIANRMGNAFASIVQSITAHMISGDHRTQSVNAIRRNLRDDYIRNVVIRSLG